MGIGEIFTTILYEPLFNGLMFLYDILGRDMGVAIIVLTLLIRALLIQPTISQLRAQRNLQSMQPKLKALQEKYKDDRQAYSQAVMRFYKENKVNPFSSCLPLLIQLPILIALYQVFIAGVVTEPETGILAAEQLDHLYGSLRATYEATPLRTTFLGIVDLSKSQNIILALLAAGATYWQSKMYSTKQVPSQAGSGGKDEATLASVNRNMLYILPVVTFIFSLTFPAGLALYWFVSTGAQIVLQYGLLRREKKEPSVA